PPTVPYWLERPRPGDVYDWPKDERRSRPFGPPILEASVPAEVAGVAVVLSAPAVYRFADAIRGELRRPLTIVPALSVSLADDLLIVPASDKPVTRSVAVRLVAHTATAAEGKVRLDVPAGW